MSEIQKLILEKFNEWSNYRFYVAIGITTLGLWLQFLLFPYWQYYFVPAIFGGILLGSDVTRGFFAGFFGMIIALLIFMNFTLIFSVEAVDILIEAALGIQGFGFIVQLIILLIWAFFSGLGGMIGVYFRPFVPCIAS